MHYFVLPLCVTKTSIQVRQADGHVAGTMPRLCRWVPGKSLSAGRRYAAVTFDDGFVGVANQAVPELVQRNIPATIFVTSDLLGHNPGWPGYPDRFMSLEELHQLPDDLIVLGSHTGVIPV